MLCGYSSDENSSLLLSLHLQSDGVDIMSGCDAIFPKILESGTSLGWESAPADLPPNSAEKISSTLTHTSSSSLHRQRSSINSRRGLLVAGLWLGYILACLSCIFVIEKAEGVDH